MIDMYECYSWALIWDGCGKISPYMLLLFLPFQENMIIIAGGVIFIRSAKRILSIVAEKSFDETEIVLMSQMIGLLAMDCLILTCSKMGILLEYSPWRVHRSVLYQFFLALFFGMILICFAFPVAKSKTRNMGWNDLLSFIIVAFFMVVCVISPWMYIDLKQNPFSWTISFLCEKNRMTWIVYMGCLITIGVFIATRLSKSMKKDVLNYKRKYFHGLATILFSPVLFHDAELMHLAFSVSLSILLGLEFIRAFQIGHVHKYLDPFMLSFTSKSRDAGPIILSHLYLLVGCALPLWVCSIVNINHWATFSGIISLGIGDAMASIIGVSKGKTFWPGQSRTIEGSLTYFCSVLLSFHILFYFFDLAISTTEMLKIVFLLLSSSLLEAFSSGNDNLLLPLFLTTGFLSFD